MIIRKVGNLTHLLIIGGQRCFSESKKQFQIDFRNKTRYFVKEYYEPPDFIYGIDVTDTIG